LDKYVGIILKKNINNDEKIEFIENCDEIVAFNNVPFIYNNALRIIEIIFTLETKLNELFIFAEKINFKKCMVIMQEITSVMIMKL